MEKRPVVPNLIVAAGCFVGLLTLQACGSGGGTRAALPGAVYANVVPVYPGAKFVGSIGGQSSNDIGGPASSESQSWFFKISDPSEEVLAFYKKKLPEAKMAEDDAGDVTFTLIPSGAQEGEHVQVIFHKGGDLQIHESLTPGKKRG